MSIDGSSKPPPSNGDNPWDSNVVIFTGGPDSSDDSDPGSIPSSPKAQEPPDKPGMTPAEAAIIIQSAWRGQVARKEFQTTRNAVVTIQSAVRALIARKDFAHRKAVFSCAKDIREQLRFYHQLIVGAQQQVDQAYRDRTLRDGTLSGHYQTIRETLELFQRIESNLDADLDDPAVVDLAKMKEKYPELLKKLEKSTYVMGAVVGLTSVELCMRTYLGEGWQLFYSEEVLNQIAEMTPVFSPMGSTTVVMEKMNDKTVRLIDRKDEGHKEYDESGRLAQGLPFIQEVSFHDTESVIEKLDAAEIVIPLPDGDRAMVIKGRFHQDPVHAAAAGGWLSLKRKAFERIAKKGHLPTPFTRKYIQEMRIRDMAILDSAEFQSKIRQDFGELQRLKRVRPFSILKEFQGMRFENMVRTITLLLMDDEGRRRAVWLMKMLEESSGNVSHLFEETLSYPTQKALCIARVDIAKELASRKQLDEKELSFKEKINLLKMNSEIDPATIEKLLEKEEMSREYGGDGQKAKTWLKRCLKIPFGNFVEDTASSDATRQEKLECLAQVRTALDKAVYGHDEAKDTIEEVVAKWIQNKGANGAVIAIQGPPGNGKTTLAREGIAKALGRPFVSMAFGGASDGSTLKGHSETYVGSKPGRIAELISEAGVMNPVIYIDELDKISKTPKGDEIVGILTHLLDPSQNKDFHDDYFAGVAIDLSKALFVLSYNDDEKIEGIMGDRLTKIKTDGLRLQDKVHVVHNYVMAKTLAENGFNPGEITISDEVIEFIVNGYTFEAGARKLIEKLTKVIGRLNVMQLRDATMIPPYAITKELVVEVLGRPKDMDIRIPAEPEIGVVNSLYYTPAALGGISPIQVGLKPSYSWGGTVFTGEMRRSDHKESLDIAETVAWQLVPPELVEEIKKKPAGAFHIFRKMPEKQKAAGGHIAAAITTAIVSTLMEVKVDNKVAITGGVDIKGNVTKTEGLKMTIIGAKRAGCTRVLVPYDNKEELRELKEKQPELFNDKDFKIEMVKTVKEVVMKSLLWDELIERRKREAKEKKPLKTDDLGKPKKRYFQKPPRANRPSRPGGRRW